MPERKCEGCKSQKTWGCTAKKIREVDPMKEDPREGWSDPADIPLVLDGEEVYSCPRQPLREEPGKWAHLLRYYGMYKRGFLPQVGAVMDQCNYAVEAFRILDAVNAECDQQEAEKPARKGPPEGFRG